MNINKKQLIRIIELVVAKETKHLVAEIKELKQRQKLHERVILNNTPTTPSEAPSVQEQPKPKQKSIGGEFGSLLENTKPFNANDSEWGMLGNRTMTTSDVDFVANGNPNQSPKISDTMRVGVDNIPITKEVPTHVANALNRDYSSLMKKMKSKKEDPLNG